MATDTRATLDRIADLLGRITHTRVGHCGTMGEVYCPLLARREIDSVLADVKSLLTSLQAPAGPSESPAAPASDGAAPEAEESEPERSSD